MKRKELRALQRGCMKHMPLKDKWIFMQMSFADQVKFKLEIEEEKEKIRKEFELLLENDKIVKNYAKKKGITLKQAEKELMPF